jgi:hypothetical protein
VGNITGVSRFRTFDERFSRAWRRILPRLTHVSMGQAQLRPYGSRVIGGAKGRVVLCRLCGKVKRERLEFLADNPLYTKRFAFFVGRRCRQATVKDVAK